MHAFLLGRFPRGFVYLVVALAVLLHPEQSKANPESPESNSGVTVTTPCNSLPVRGFRAYPQANFGCGYSVQWLGEYSADTKYRTGSSYTRLNSDGAPARAVRRPAEVPPFVDLHPIGRVVPNYLPPARATQKVSRHSTFPSLFDKWMTAAYGHENTLLGPQHIAQDSKGRLIVSDPTTTTLHVLNGKDSFRIAGGKDRRLRMPGAVAVDANDRIYVIDRDSGLIQVYDPDGIYLYSLGKLGNESQYDDPTALAIDSKLSALYIVDTGRNLVVKTDTGGRAMARVGRYRGRILGTEFENPHEIAVANDHVYVLDRNGSRVKVFDLNLNFVRELALQVPVRGPASEIGFGVDDSGEIFVTAGGGIRIFSSEGVLLGAFGQSGARAGEFTEPSGLCVDRSGKLFVSDTYNSRVQVFQIGRPEILAGTAPPVPVRGSE